MTDGEKLDLLLDKVASIEKDLNTVKRQIMKSTAELKAMDEMILDEVERVHRILDKHKLTTQCIRHNHNYIHILYNPRCKVY